jgi:hypothetical protein
MGLRRVRRDLVLVGATVGVEVPLELLVNLSLMPLSSDVCDLEKLE